jgi:hypothetical protein
MIAIYVKVNFVEHGLDSMTCGNIRCIILNLKTLTRYNKTSKGATSIGTDLA